MHLQQRLLLGHMSVIRCETEFDWLLLRSAYLQFQWDKLSSEESFEEFLLHVQVTKRSLQEDELLGGWEPKVSRCMVCHCAFLVFFLIKWGWNAGSKLPRALTLKLMGAMTSALLMSQPVMVLPHTCPQPRAVLALCPGWVCGTRGTWPVPDAHLQPGLWGTMMVFQWGGAGQWMQWVPGLRSCLPTALSYE